MAPQQSNTTNQRLTEIASRLDEHQERLDQHEQRLNKYDVIIVKLETLQQTMNARMDASEPMLHDTAQALVRLDEKANSNRLWINLVVSIILVTLGGCLGLLGNYLVHLLP